MLKNDELLLSLTERFCSDSAIKSAVLFGSHARALREAGAADAWSDIDLHVITSSPAEIKSRRWANSLPGQKLCMHVVRPASGGVHKVTMVFSNGEVDLVLLPAVFLRAVRLALKTGLYRRVPSLLTALNAMSTIMRGGYRFIKGEDAWGAFYSRVVNDLPGYRLNERQIIQMADVFFCDLLWVFQKLDRGELIAAQRIIHNSLNEINIQLIHESRLRRNEITFQQARRAENLLSPPELSRIQITAHLNREELRVAARHSFESLSSLMVELISDWHMSASLMRLMRPYLSNNKGYQSET